MAIAAPAMVVDSPSPGLGHYIRDCNGLAERPMSTAVFASRTERISQRLLAYTRPGPGNAKKSKSMIYPKIMFILQDIICCWDLSIFLFLNSGYMMTQYFQPFGSLKHSEQ